MSRRLSYLAIVAGLYLPAAACTGGADAVATWTVRDSAGITIVDDVLTSAAEEGWRVAPSPSLSVGVLDGDPEYQLFQVSGATLLEDGRIAVVNSGTREIRFFGPDGTFEGSMGSDGEGPGEYRRPRLMGTFGADSLVVYDSDMRRVSVLHVRDGYARSFRVDDAGGGFPVSQGLLADGTLLFGGGLFFSSDDGFPTGLIRNDSHYSTMSRVGEPVADLGDFPGPEMFAKADGNRFMASSIPFARSTRVATAGTQIFLALQDKFEIRAYSPLGELTRLIRLDRPTRTVTGDDLEALIQDRIDGEDDDNARRETRQRYEEMPLPESMPAFGSMIADVLGNLWVEDYRLPGEEEAQWTIFDPEGKIIGRVGTPAGLRPVQIGEDYVLGEYQDEFDVEYVRLHALERPARE